MRAVVAVLLFAVLAPVAWAQDDAKISDEAWDQYFEEEAELTAALLEGNRARSREIRDELQQVLRDRNLSRDDRRSKADSLRTEREQCMQDIELIEEGQLYGKPRLNCPPAELNGIGYLIFPTNSRLVVSDSIDDTQAVYTVQSRVMFYGPNGQPTGIRTVETQPFLVTNELEQVETTRGSHPSTEGLFRVGMAYDHYGDHIPQVVAMDVDLNAERDRWRRRNGDTQNPAPGE